jgi:leader peptidase (prepilin peptidase)/N-methyltransferase
MPTFWILFVFLVAFGACVGSFLNVVIYRLPEGKSIVSPPSSCPRCGHGLAWYDNVPVLGWLWLRGKCRYCRNPISVQYPIVEAITALLFGGLYLAYYTTDLRPAFAEAGPISDGLGGTWPVLLVHLLLIGALLAATVIDAKLYIIPLSLPYAALLAALAVLPASEAAGWLPYLGVERAGALPSELSEQLGLHIDWLVDPALLAGPWSVALGWLGVLISVGLLCAGKLPRSFLDEADYLEEPESASVGEAVGFYPHARREMFKEMLAVAPIVLGFVLGLLIDFNTGPADLPRWALVLIAVLNGALLGGALVWGTRILGTLAFGKEAMGLGDVHLMVGVGAVIGPLNTILAFFVAPFMGLLIYAVMLIVGKARRDGGVRMIPYGPFLAAGAVAVLIWRNPLLFLIGF